MMNKYIQKFRESIAKLDEDAEKDYRLIKEAEVVYNEFLDKIKENKELIVNQLNKNGYIIVQLFNNNYPSLKIFVHNIDKTRGSYDYIDNTIRLYLEDLLYNTWYKKYFMNHNITEDILLKALNLPQIKSTFLHEYQHYKYDTNDKTKEVKYKVDSDEDYKKYRQNPNENNSFTIQDLNHIIASFKSYLKDNSINATNKKNILNTLNSYINILYNEFKRYNPWIYDGHSNQPLSGQPRFVKGMYMEKQYYKRIYNLLYYLFVEGNIDNAKKIYNEIKRNINESNNDLEEDTVKQGNSWTNKGKEGTHGKFKTKKEADAQRKAMFANGYKG